MTMLTRPTLSLDDDITAFHTRYALRLEALIHALDAACISHYSSGCEHKRVTFDLFPASAHVREILHLISLERPLRTGSKMGLRDATANNMYNPGDDFILYLKRWSLFCEHAMHAEGDSPRGIAAARAKLIMADLIAELNGPQPEIAAFKKTGRKTENTQLNGFSTMMRNIGLALEKREHAASSQKKSLATQKTRQNYFKALEAARLSDESQVA